MNTKEQDSLGGPGKDKETRQAELDLILQQTEALTPNQRKQKDKEKEETIIELRSGRKTSLKEVNDYLSSIKQPYQSHFGYDKPYYEYIYKLNWPNEDYREFVKRQEVAVWTVRLIYGRFPDGVVQFLKKQNKFLFEYIRTDKYFQYLSPEAQNLLDDFISDFNRMIVGYNDWDKFEEDYCKKYKISYQNKIEFPI